MTISSEERSKIHARQVKNELANLREWCRVHESAAPTPDDRDDWGTIVEHLDEALEAAQVILER